MFKHLSDLAYQRNAKEAIGFYLAYLILFVITGAFLGAIIGVILQGDPNMLDYAIRAGTILGIILSSGISFLIIQKKKLLGHFGWILLALLAGLIASFLGGLGGLIPAAYLTTRPIDKNAPHKS